MFICPKCNEQFKFLFKEIEDNQLHYPCCGYVDKNWEDKKDDDLLEK